MQTKTVILIAAAALVLGGVAVAIPVSRDLYRDAPQSAPEASDAAMKLYGEMAAGKLNRSRLTKPMNDAFTPELLKQLQAQFTELGDPTGLTLDSTQAMAGGMNYVFIAHFTGGDHKLQIYLTQDGKVGGFHILP